MSERKQSLEQQVADLDELIHAYEVDEYYETDPLSRRRIGKRLEGLRSAKNDKEIEIQLITAAQDADCQATQERLPTPFSCSRMPSTGPYLFGRAQQLARLTAAWDTSETNILVLVAWGGVGKTALVNSWLGKLGYANYRNAESVYVWSFYTQGITERVTSAELFIETALRDFGDLEPTLGSTWEKGTRLANLIRTRRTLLIVDGLEPLQHPPGPDEGRIKDSGLIALFSELAQSNSGLCVITTRLRIEDLTKFDKKSVIQRDLENLNSKAGASLLRASGVHGPKNQLEAASKEFEGHALALTLLGSFLKIVHGGDVERRNRIVLLEGSTREGRHARRVMASYEQWIYEQSELPDLALLYLISLFDRPADEAAVKYLLADPPLPGLTEDLADLDTAAWNHVVARLTSTRLLLEKSFGRTDEFDMHPLVREYFGERLRIEHPTAWSEGNRRLFNYYKSAVCHQPDNIQDMQYLFHACVCGCKGELFAEVLHEIYIPRISRGNLSFAATALGASNALLSVLTYFFHDGDWQRPVEGLSDNDKLYVLMESGRYLTQTRGYAASEVGQCYGLAKDLAVSVGSKRDRLEILLGLCRFYRVRAELGKSGSLAQDILHLCEEIGQDDLYPLAYRAIASNFYYRGCFEEANEYSQAALLHSVTLEQATQNAILDVNDPSVSCLGYQALATWLLGKTSLALDYSSEATAQARELNHPHTLAITLLIGAMVHQFHRDFSNVETIATELVSVCAERGFSLWRKAGEILLLWSQAIRGQRLRSNQKMIGDLIEEWLGTNAELFAPYWYGLLAEIFLATKSYREARLAIESGLLLSKRNDERWWDPELLRLKCDATRAVDDGEVAMDALREALELARDKHAIALMPRIFTSADEFKKRYPIKCGDSMTKSLLDICRKTSGLEAGGRVETFAKNLKGR